MIVDASKEIEGVVRLARFESATRILWDGENIDVSPPEGSDASQGEPPIVRTMGSYLYAGCYVRPIQHLRMRSAHAHARVPAIGRGTADPLLDTGWRDALDEANATAAAWEPGWRVIARATTQLEIEKGKHRRTVHPHDIRPESGDRYELRVERGSAQLQPGWYYVNGEHTYGLEPSDQTYRLYWNISRMGALMLVNHLSRQLNQANIPFRYKTPSHPGAFNRADSGVLYLPAKAWPKAIAALHRVHAAISIYLRTPTPLFTRSLAPGLGFAEDPGAAAESFGTHRCRQIARGLWAAYGKGLREPAEVAAVVLDTLSAEGLDIRRLHLRPSTRHDPSNLYVEEAVTLEQRTLGEVIQ